MASNQQEQAFELTKEMLKTTNASSLGSSSEYLINVLESTSGSLSLKGRIGDYLRGLSIFSGLTIDSDKYNKLNSIEDKLAYLISISFPTTVGLLTDIQKNSIQLNITDVITSIKNYFSQNERIKESDVVVMSALSNFKVSISETEKTELNDISKKIKKLLKDNPLEHTLGEITEEPVQRIQKLKTVIALLEQKGLINSDTTQAVSDFKTKFVPKLKELNEFNEEYYKLDNARTIFYKVDAKYGKIKVLSTKDQAKLESAMKELGVDDIETYITTLYGQLGAGESREAKDKILDKGLGTLKKNAKFRTTLREKKIKQPDFERMYLSLFSLQLLERAREGFHSKKGLVFGDNEGKFDETIANWRKLKRDKIIKLWNNGTTPDIVGLQNIYNNDSKVFYELAVDDLNNQKIKDALIKVIDHQYSSLEQKEKDSLFEHILSRNNANSQLYYGKINEPDEAKLKRQEMTFSALSMVGKTGSFLNKKAITPSLKALARTAEFTFGTIIGKGIFGTIAKASVGVENILKKTNAKITKKPTTWRGKILKSPVLLAFPVTKMLELGGTATNWTGKQTVGRVATGINMANDGINNQVKKWSNNEINTWFEGILVGGISKGALGWGVGTLYEKQVMNKLDEKMSREEKERVVSDFYGKLSDGKPQEKVARILEGLDVAQKVNDSHPYIFDKIEEGVKVTDELKEEKEKLSKETLEKMLEQITKIKGNITLEKDSQNKYISEVMKQLEKKFGEIENIINGKGKFEDKLDQIVWVFNKVVSDLGGGIYGISPSMIGGSGSGTSYVKPSLKKGNAPTGNGELLTLMKKKYKNEELIIEHKITNDVTQNRISTALSGSSTNIASAQNSLQQTITLYNDKIDKLEEENLLLEQAISKFDGLTKSPLNKFSDILKLISDDTTSPSILKKIKEEYAKDNTTGYSKANYETQHKALITELSKIDIS